MTITLYSLGSINQVSPKLWRGPRIATFEDMKELQLQGVTRIINLESTIERNIGDPSFEYFWADSLGIEIVDVPLSAIFTPSYEPVRHVLHLIETCEGKVYVHCRQGKDRTGFVVAVYQVARLGWKLNDAITLMYDYGFHLWYFFWVNKIYPYSEKLKNGV